MRRFIITLGFFLNFISPAHAFSVTHDFEVVLGVFDAARTRFTYELTPETYRVGSEVATNGFFDTLYPFKAVYATDGLIKPSGFLTQNYKYTSKSRFSKRSKELIYNNKGEPVYRLSSKDDTAKKVKIEESPNNAGTTDLQTVMAKLSKQYNELKFCDSRMEVFDGKRRFSVIFKDEGSEELPKHERSPYFGKAAKCSMYIDKLGAKGDDLLWELTSDRPVYFWIMEDPATKIPFIARIQIENTPLGKLDVYTGKIEIKG